MQICTSLQTDNHASMPPLIFYRPDALPATQPTASKHWRQYKALKAACWGRLVQNSLCSRLNAKHLDGVPYKHIWIIGILKPNSNYAYFTLSLGYFQEDSEISCFPVNYFVRSSSYLCNALNAFNHWININCVLKCPDVLTVRFW